MKNKFNIGDKVQIRKDLKVGSRYGSLTLYGNSMGLCRGQICTVSGKTGQGNYDVAENPFVWSEEMLVKYSENKVIFSDKATVLIKDGKKYVSKCKDGDAYDKEKGLLLCLAQANGISYRDLQEMIAGAKDCNAEKAKEFAGKLVTAATEAAKAFAAALNGDKKTDDKAQVREVEREAKVGEYIKIVRGYAAHGLYKNGDIFKVYKVASLGGVYCDMPKKTGAYTRDNGNIIIWHDEYVVLENYKPYKITLSEFWANEGKEIMAIHCKTEDEAKELLKAFDRMGKRWSSGKSYASLTHWGEYGEKTIYDNTNGFANMGGLFHREDVKNTYEFAEVDLEN